MKYFRTAKISILLLSIFVLLFNVSTTYADEEGTWVNAQALDEENGEQIPLMSVSELITNGNVLIAGVDTSSSYLYNSVLNQWDTIDGFDSVNSNIGITSYKLGSGKILVAGFNSFSPLTNEEISGQVFDPTTNAWTKTGPAVLPIRIGHAGSILSNGKVLISGGYGGFIQADSQQYPDAEIYDPQTNQWSATGDMNEAKNYHTSTLLQDGKVLVTGGGKNTYFSGYGIEYKGADTVNTAELYDPSSGTWFLTNPMNQERSGHTATLLDDGKVLIVGGEREDINGDDTTHTVLASAEVYDPVTEQWTNTGNMHFPRIWHTATKLPNGKVLVIGGLNGVNTYKEGLAAYNSAEVYDPVTGVWENVSSPMHEERAFQTTLLNNNKVFVAGGIKYVEDESGLNFVPLNNAEILTLTSLQSGGEEISVQKITVNQAVDAIKQENGTTSVLVDVNADNTADLVANRPAVVRVNVTPSGFTSEQVIEFQLKIGNQTLPVQSATAASLQSTPVNLFFTPPNVGNTTISVTIDPQNKLQLSNLTQPESLTVDVKPVRELKYISYPVNYLGSTSNYSSTISNGVDFLKGVYPVSNISIVQESSYTETPLSRVPHVGGYHDAQNLFVMAMLKQNQPERVIGIVPQEWINLHLSNSSAQGVVYGGVSSVAFVKDNYPLVAVHEVGHTYGFDEGYILNSNGSCCSHIGDSTSGYWVQRQREVNNSIDYMGASTVNPPAYPDDAIQRWSTIDNFESLFKKFRTDPTDPAVLIVTGEVKRDGTATINNMYRKPDGFLTESNGNDALIIIKDSNGAVLSTTPFKIDYTMSESNVELNAAPFAMVLPYPEDAAQLQVVKNNIVLTQVTPTSELLAEAIRSIPDNGYWLTPNIQRKVLLAKVQALDYDLDHNNKLVAYLKLKYDIRTNVNLWIKNNYQPATPLQYSKQSLLQLIDELALKLIN